MDTATAPPPASLRLLDAALQTIRAKGYAATTVDDLCAAAGVTKGSFFHHHGSKEEMVLAAVEHWNAGAAALFAAAPWRRLPDPRDRVLGYVDQRAQLIQGAAADYTCLLGTLVQEIHASHPRLRAACRDGIERHARDLSHDIAAAKARHAPRARWDPMGLALYTQAALQGAFILAKADGDAAVVAVVLGHLRQHVANLLGAASGRPAPRTRKARP